jgi:hypothetical protein
MCKRGRMRRKTRFSPQEPVVVDVDSRNLRHFCYWSRRFSGCDGVLAGREGGLVDPCQEQRQLVELPLAYNEAPRKLQMKIYRQRRTSSLTS